MLKNRAHFAPLDSYWRWTLHSQARANKLLVPVTAGDAAAYRGGFICRDASAIRASERASERRRVAGSRPERDLGGDRGSSRTLSPTPLPLPLPPPSWRIGIEEETGGERNSRESRVYPARRFIASDNELSSRGGVGGGARGEGEGKGARRILYVGGQYAQLSDPLCPLN
jgi:hypothetical protein